MKQARIKRGYCNSEKEHNIIFNVIEQNDNRCIIAPVESDLLIIPTELISTNTLSFIKGTK